MAIDTELKRRSAQNYGIGVVLPVPGAGINEAERATLNWLYSGISYLGPITLNPFSCDQTSAATSPTATYTYQLTADNAVQAQIVTEPTATYSEVTNLLPEDNVQVQLVDSPTATYTFQLDPENCVQAQLAQEAAIITGVKKSCLVIGDETAVCASISDRTAVCASIGHD